MSRIAKNNPNTDAVFTVATDSGRRAENFSGELAVIRGGKRAYLAVRGKGDAFTRVIFSGPATLRALAKAILKEVGDK